MSDKKVSTNLYSKIGDIVEFLRVYKKDNNNFDLKIKKKSYDKVCKMYGNERLTPVSFICYQINTVESQLTRLKTMNKELEEGEADKILEAIHEYLIIPESLASLDEEKQFELAIKMKGKYIKDIFKKAGFNMDSLLEYANVQIVEQEIEETTKVQISYYIYENIFRLVPLLKVIPKEGETFDIAFYSYRNILNKCGIELEKIIPYLQIKQKDINREELIKKNIPLYEKSKVRELKGKINEDIKEEKIYILKGGDMCKRYPTIPFDDFELNGNEGRNILNDIPDKIKNKKNSIKKIYENSDNQIIEIKDINNKVFFIRKKVKDSILSLPESQNDEYIINDIDNNEIIISKNKLKENKNSPLVKLYNKNNNKEFIYIPKNEIDDDFNKFKYIKQNNNFKGKNKNGEHKEITFLLMDAECENLPKLDDSKPLYSIASTKNTNTAPVDFSDINERLLKDIIPQNELLLSKDHDNKDILMLKLEGDNLTKYPQTDFDNFDLYDKDGKIIKVSRKKIEKDNKDIKCQFIEIKDNDNNKNELVNKNQLIDSLKNKEDENIEIKNKDGNILKLKKKNIEIIKQDNKYINLPEQGEELKKKLLSEIKDSFIKVKDSKNNKDELLRTSQLNEVINHKQKAPFINYELQNPKKEKVHITKQICQEKISNPNNKLILCYDDSQKEKPFLVPLTNIQNSKCNGNELFDIGNGKKIPFKNLRIKQLDNSPEMGTQLEEEKMLKIYNLINKIKSSPLNKNYKTQNLDGNVCFVSNNYIPKLQNESNNNDKDSKFKIHDAFGKNKVILTKKNIDKDSKPGDYILIKNKDDNQNYLVDYNDLMNNLNSFKSTDDEIIIANSLDNRKMKLNPLSIEIVPPYNDFPIEKLSTKKKSPEKIEEGRTRLRSMPLISHIPEKKAYKIRRAIIYKKQRKDSQ